MILSAHIVPSLFGPGKTPIHLLGRKVKPKDLKLQGAGQRILVVDDEVVIADSLAEILSDHGYQAHAFYDGQTAIAAARDTCPDLVLCDVVMPELNGVETVMAIRKLCARTRIFLFSGQAHTKDLLEVARAQGHLFEVLPKPMHPKELLKRLALKRG
jgi:DNA-binding response OmpR family regulator